MADVFRNWREIFSVRYNNGWVINSKRNNKYNEDENEMEKN